MWQRALCHKMKTASRAEVELESEQEMLADFDFVTELAKRAGVILERKDRTMADICEYSIVITGPLETLQKIKVLLESAVEHKGNDYLRDDMIDCDKLFPEAAGASRTPHRRWIGVDSIREAESELLIRGICKWTMPTIGEELAKRFPDTAIIVTRDTGHGCWFDRWQVNAKGCRCLDSGVRLLGEHDPVFQVKDGIFQKTSQPSEFQTWEEVNKKADLELELDYLDYLDYLRGE